MKMKLMMAAAFAAAVLPGGGVAHADPAKPSPDPHAPKCWITTPNGDLEYAPCGWCIPTLTAGSRFRPHPSRWRHRAARTSDNDRSASSPGQAPVR
jgi:hypothetical protein